jgi:predicted HTH domain antitoxin
VTLGQAATVAGISQPEFLRELGQRKIPVHHGEEELEQDLAAVQKLVAQQR